MKLESKTGTLFPVGSKKKKAILVAEDDDFLRRTIVHILESDDYIVISAKSGNEALRFLESIQVDLIISDIQMPDGDGYALLEGIKSRSTHSLPPFAFITGRTDIKLTEIKSCGASILFEKPFSVGHLLEWVAAQLSFPTNSY